MKVFYLNVLIAVIGSVGCEAAFAVPHSLVKRGLQEAHCIPSSLVVASQSSKGVAYDVTCRGASRRRLVLVCTATRCFPDDHRHFVDDD